MKAHSLKAFRIIRFSHATLVACLLSTVLCSTGTMAQNGDFTDGEKLFALNVKPLLADKCFSCHGDDPEEIEGELDLTSLESMLKGGEFFDDVLIPGDAEFSFMMEAVRWEDPDFEMPPKKNDRLTEKQIWAIRDWIDAGAPWPKEETIAAIRVKYAEGVILQTSGALSDEWANRRYKEDDLWAYQELSSSSSSSHHSIDSFIQARLNAEVITPAPPAKRRTLIRRATFDLIGLPPTPQETEDFLNDKRPEEQAFATVVDRLLADHRYGEQWGRHWLDVVRYADTAGYSNDFERPTAWRYRDYVIRSFNEDKPYDRFIKEQIAGDELYPKDTEALIATGYLRMGPWEHTVMSVERLTRQQFLDDVTDSVGQTFLSHPLQCARCHDHKFDPIPTKDYYRIQAVFGTTQFVERDSQYLDTENTSSFDQEVELYQKRIAVLEETQKGLREKKAAAIAAWCKERGIPVAPEPKLRSEDIPEDQRLPRNYGLSNQEIGLLKVQGKNLQRIQGELGRYNPTVFSVYSGATRSPKRSDTITKMPKDPMKGGKIEASHILTGGDPFSLGENVTPGVFSALPNSNDTLQANEYNSIPESPDGRRAAFANWLTSPQNPLVLRSIVNRVWHYHFGRGIAATPNNFGAMGKKPTHPELLDYLARSFADESWSFKKLHREIMLSEAYRRSSKHPQRETLANNDPNNESYAYFQSRRLSAEEIRDSMLFVSGELNPEAGGIPIRPEMDLEVALQPRQVMGSFALSYEASQSPEDRNRRSIYSQKIRSLRNPFFEVFNQPSPDLSCEARDASTVTPQAFSLFNSQDTLKRSIALANSLIQNSDTRKATIKTLFNKAYGRAPSNSELRLCLKHWDKMKKRHEGLHFEPTAYPTTVTREAAEEMTGEIFSFNEELFAYKNYTRDLEFADVDANTRALAEVCLVVFNSNEFLYIY